MPVDSLASVTVPLSRQQLFTLLWVPVILIAVFGVLGMSAHWCCRNPTWQKVPLSWMAGSIICVAPIALLLSGLFMFLVIIMVDVCNSLPNIGFNYLTAFGGDMCSGALGGRGNLSTCVLAPQLTGVDLQLQIDVPLLRLYRSLMHTCEAPDPIATLTHSVAAQIVTVPYTGLASFFETSDVGQALQLRPALRNIVYTAANATGVRLQEGIASIGSNVLDCTAMNTAVSELRRGVCDTVTTPLFWYALAPRVHFLAASLSCHSHTLPFSPSDLCACARRYVGAWLVLGWTLLCLGLPAALRARKRIPAVPWGPAIKDYESGKFVSTYSCVVRRPLCPHKTSLVCIPSPQ
ncbi:MAG: hypothetical protein EOO65_00855 [Methanosarcinales archaeon]|nr:MAG: hypothetical protein EOO65_00855 [Methanosarcinales archaeon]